MPKIYKVVIESTENCLQLKEDQNMYSISKEFFEELLAGKTFYTYEADEDGDYHVASSIEELEEGEGWFIYPEYIKSIEELKQGER